MQLHESGKENRMDTLFESEKWNGGWYHESVQADI